MIMDDEKFFAWLDGELDAAEADAVAALVAADPGLQRKADAHRRLKARLGEAFAPIAVAIPAPSNVVNLAEVRARRSLPSMAQWAAIAATLVLGLATGSMLTGGSRGPVSSEAGLLIGLTFRDSGGAVCRSFTDGSAQGLACRHGKGWRIRGLFQAGEGQSGAFRMAAGPDPALAALVDSTIAGEPFDATAERGARDADWR